MEDWIVSDQPLILVAGESLTVTAADVLLEMKEAALASSALVSRVRDSVDNDVASRAQADLRSIIGLIEKSRKDAKEPFLKLGKGIDAMARQLAEDLTAEHLRVAKLVGDFQTLELAKQRAAENAAREEASKLERERMAALAEAETHEEADRIQDDFARKAQDAPAPVVIEPARAAGQLIREEWNITVTNPNDLARAHPQCVTITPKLQEIKLLLNAGIEVRGVTAKKEVIAISRASKSSLQITNV